MLSSVSLHTTKKTVSQPKGEIPSGGGDLGLPAPAGEPTAPSHAPPPLLAVPWALARLLWYLRHKALPPEGPGHPAAADPAPLIQHLWVDVPQTCGDHMVHHYILLSPSSTLWHPR